MTVIMTSVARRPVDRYVISQRAAIVRDMRLLSTDDETVERTEQQSGNCWMMMVRRYDRKTRTEGRRYGTSLRSRSEVYETT